MLIMLSLDWHVCAKEDLKKWMSYAVRHSVWPVSCANYFLCCLTQQRRNCASLRRSVYKWFVFGFTAFIALADCGIYVLCLIEIGSCMSICIEILAIRESFWTLRSYLPQQPMLPKRPDTGTCPWIKQTICFSPNLGVKLAILLYTNWKQRCQIL